MTLPLHYWLVSSGDLFLFSFALPVVSCLSVAAWDQQMNWDQVIFVHSRSTLCSM
ncbi:hypothetical protein BV25DRAFT_1820556 [Artomyces pyxidatus]|uniref:Uncharacterized protein n=1 Tax=Artomyces pyxidatus TaxID=48021 RepID=A0ACB8TDR8_9AGAM|nr:hypothetical protein BV25DRAFT_1820556 [Artomyces pyxidatus]